VFEWKEASPIGTLVLTAFLSKEQHGLCGAGEPVFAVRALAALLIV
jgi:hypothetical protein